MGPAIDRLQLLYGASTRIETFKRQIKNMKTLKLILLPGQEESKRDYSMRSNEKATSPLKLLEMEALQMEKN